MKKPNFTEGQKLYFYDPIIFHFSGWAIIKEIKWCGPKKSGHWILTLSTDEGIMNYGGHSMGLGDVRAGGDKTNIFYFLGKNKIRCMEKIIRILLDNREILNNQLNKIGNILNGVDEEEG